MAEPVHSLGSHVALHVQSLYGLAHAEAQKWADFRRDILALMDPRAPSGGQPGKHPATDTGVFLVFPPNPGRVNACFFNDGGAAKCYLYLTDVNSSVASGFSWVLAAGQGISLESISPGYRGTVQASFSAIDAVTVLGFTEFIG